MNARSRVRLSWFSAAAAVAALVWGLWSTRSTDRPVTGDPPGPPAGEQQVSAGAAALMDAPKRYVPLAAARPLMDALKAHVPADLRGAGGPSFEAAWATWVSAQDEAIRARVRRGDEDSLVFFWYYGTSFTDLPPVTARNAAGLDGPEVSERVLQARLDRLLEVLASPGADERLLFARSVLERQGIDPSTAAGLAEARRYFADTRTRVVRESDGYQQSLQSLQQQDSANALAAFATMYRERGLSSDTSLLAAFAIEQALSELRAEAVMGEGAVRRAALVGPGLDFANKDDGYDFYPVQTIQPFALADSLVRLRLAPADDLTMATLDLSDRVNRHIDTARRNAHAGQGYVLHLSLDAAESWNPELTAFWAHAGSAIGREAQPLAPPSSAGKIQVRAVAIRPPQVLSVVPKDLNIVLERLDLAPDMRFDLVVATNIFVYYDPFEQALSLANVAAMLRPGGILLSNTPLPPSAEMKLSERFTSVAYSDRRRDYVFSYTRQ